MGLEAGARLGPYEVRGLLGAGGMGEVYRASDPRLGRDVAIKVLPGAAAVDSDRLERFQREARAAGALNHPNVLAVFDVGFEGGVPYVVSELLEGKTLSERIRYGDLSVQKAIQYGVQIAQGMAAAHDRGIVHRDLKPDNLFLTKGDRVKILDFGLAKLREPARVWEGRESQQLTASQGTDAGVLLGTVGYMSPEQARGLPADHRSDIFSFGAVLYEMLAERRAFQGTSAAETLAAILKEDPPELARPERPLPTGLERIVRRCLEKDPEHRFRSAHDLALALDALSGSASALSDVAVPDPVRRRHLALAVVALLALGAGAAAVASWVGGRSNSARGEPVRFFVTLPPGASLDNAPVASVIALSPDGRQVAFVAAATGRLTRIWLRSLEGLSLKPLEGTENAVSPFWSPDGRFLAYFSEGKLRKVQAHGGPPEVVCDTEGFATSGTWNAEGTILFGQVAGPRAGLWRVSASGGTPERVQTDAGELGSWPQFLPDGRHFLFLTLTPGAGGSRGLLRAGSLAAPATQQLIPGDSRATYVEGGRLLFARDGALMTVPFDVNRRSTGGEATPLGQTVAYLRASGAASFSASTDGRALAYVPRPAPTQLTWFDRSGRPTGKLGEPARIYGFRLSPNGRKAIGYIFDLRKGARDIWVDDIERGVRSRLTADPHDSMAPIWDPGGERIVYSSARGGPPQLYLRGAEASGDERLLLDVPGSRFARDWSQDGRRIALEDFAPGRRVRFQLWILEPGPPVRVTPFAHGQANKYDPQFSPDGSHLAFTSEETGRPEVFVASLDGSSQLQVSSEGGSKPRWRGDGKELFYLNLHGELVSAGITPKPRLTVGQRQLLFAYPVTMSVGTQQWGPEYDVTADGQRFLFNLEAEPPSGSFVVLLNWQGSLGR